MATKPAPLIELGNKYNFDITKKIIIFTQHSVTTEFEESLSQVEKTIEALKDLDDVQIISFFSNTDAGGKKIIESISKEEKFIKIPNMQSSDFLSLMSYSSLMIGNSSAGIREAPSFQLPVINIGSRQNGRLRAENVIDVEHDVTKIKEAIDKCLNDDLFLLSLKNIENPYGDGSAAVKIVDVLETVELNNDLIQKEICYDL